MLELKIVKRTEPNLLECMNIHYSKPKGFVGRNICYAILYQELLYGFIVGGSATRFLPGRNEFLQVTNLNQIVNNIFYHIAPRDKKYPLHNFTTKVITYWRKRISKDWENKYGDKVLGFETLVELPRLGTCYLKDDWIEVGITIGYTCKRIGGIGTDSWTGKRIWDIKNLRPKRVLCRFNNVKERQNEYVAH